MEMWYLEQIRRRCGFVGLLLEVGEGFEGSHTTEAA